MASVQSLDDARAQRDTAQANVAQAQANTQIAAINYSYTRVLAPFDGRVSAHLVSIGDLVGTQPTKLATIVQIKPIYVTFNVSEQVVIRIRGAALREGRRVESDPRRSRSRSACRERLDTRTVGIWITSRRRSIPQPEHWLRAACWRTPTGSLLPGYFARVRVPLETGVEALLVPDAALAADQGGRYLLVVGADHVVVAEARDHRTAGGDAAGDRDRSGRG